MTTDGYLGGGITGTDSNLGKKTLKFTDGQGTPGDPCREKQWQRRKQRCMLGVNAGVVRGAQVLKCGLESIWHHEVVTGQLSRKR